jgi:CubicO group peptidase (beta-lactamase class C family)
MHAQVRNNHYSGAVLVSRDGEVLIKKGYGLADVEWQIPNKPDTRFSIASVSKQFTAVLIMKLQEEGKLRVTDRVCLYLDPCPESWSSIRISHLLSHTSGISDFTETPSFSTDLRLSHTKDEVVLMFRDKPLESVPGDKFRYSNSNYFLLGMILEKVAGKPFDDELANEVLEPLGMKDTGVIDNGSIIEKRARGYRPAADGRVVDAETMDPSWSFGAGQMYSTVEDLKIWDDALYSDKVLPRSTLKSMWTPVKDDYGLGWNVPAVSHATLDRRVIYHSGSSVGFISCVSRFPEGRLLVVVLANYTMVKHACSVATGLAAIAYGDPAAARRDPVRVQLDPKIEARYVGSYHVSSDLDVQVTLEDGTLFATIEGQPKLAMLASSEREFFLKDFDTQLDFIVDAAGKATGFVAHIPLRDDIFGRKVD